MEIVNTTFSRRFSSVPAAEKAKDSVIDLALNSVSGCGHPTQSWLKIQTRGVAAAPLVGGGRVAPFEPVSGIVAEHKQQPAIK
ncbi:hypothetical protein Bca52824_015326 [Brassica carinata]|uniref:Uncharacterized protein n=1 Tax=Brassica carinata TaxID=52824 RepID=A0A8X7W1H4_BRACI|nr:hypothetical protein Bca52824_015326 [Brassica carinata]